MGDLTPRERVERALRGEPVDKTPFTVYESKIPQCAAEREMRNLGLCIVNRRYSVIKTHHPNVRITTTHYEENGKGLVRTDYDTPYGNLHTIDEPAGFTSWHRKHLFSGPEDYRKLVFMVDDEQYEANYGPFIEAEKWLGGDVSLRGGIGSEPLQTLISGWMGTERFCFEWMERRDEVQKLYEALVRAARRRYPLLADSPCRYFNYGGNVTVEVIGPKVFAEYYVPHYQEAAEALHKTGKFVGSHHDGNCKVLAPQIARTDLDYIEAFTPAPDTDLSLAEAIAAWPGKAIWINFPSSVHLASEEKIAQTTRDLLEAAAGHPRFLIGITEDVPEDRWQGNFLTILRTIDEYRHVAR